MSTVIAATEPSRSWPSYDLRNEIMEKYGISDREAHAGIIVFLDQLIGIHGRDAVVISEKPMRPQLLEFNPRRLDVDYWVEITDEAADDIREAFAAAPSTGGFG